MSKYIYKSHNVSVLLYHLVCPIKYRKKILAEKVLTELKNISKEISLHYEIEFIEIGTDGDHVHFLIQSVATYSVTKISKMVKSLTAREIFRRLPEVTKELWGSQFWTDGYVVNTVGEHGNEEVIKKIC
jgi:putative transposase